MDIAEMDCVATRLAARVVPTILARRAQEEDITFTKGDA